jgi:hypothetical protein
MTRTIALADLFADGETVTAVVPASKVREAVRAMYGSESMFAVDARLVDEFHEAINEQDDLLAANLAAQLGIGWEEVSAEEGF